MGKVIPLGGVTKPDLPAESVLDSVLDAAKKEGLKTCVVLGWDKDDSLYLTTNKPSILEILWLLEKAKKAILDV